MLSKVFYRILFLSFLALMFTSGAMAEDAKNILPDRVIGKAEAPVIIYDYSSLTCPHCAEFHARTLPEIKKQFIDTGKAKLIFRDYPLDKAALQASVLTRCADETRFFPLVDVLFQNQAKWALSKNVHESLTSYGVLAGISKEKYDACLKDKKIEDSILAMRVEGETKYKITSTPTFVLAAPNGKTKTIVGETTVEEFGKAINSLQ